MTDTASFHLASSVKDEQQFVFAVMPLQRSPLTFKNNQVLNGKVTAWRVKAAHEPPRAHVGPRVG
jgi:hypothetical protein